MQPLPHLFDEKHPHELLQDIDRFVVCIESPLAIIICLIWVHLINNLSMFLRKMKNMSIEMILLMSRVHFVDHVVIFIHQIFMVQDLDSKMISYFQLLVRHFSCMKIMNVNMNYDISILF